MNKKNLFKNLSIYTCSILLTSTVLFAEEKTEKLQDITILGETSSNYANVKKVKLLRNNISLEESAKSVQVFNDEFINDYQPQFINDIVTLSSSAVYLGDNFGRENNFAIRGFSGTSILRDGFNLGNASAYPEIYNIERVEVLKGPDSLQFGESNPGGLINLVKKKVQKEKHTQLELELTTNKSYSPKLDIGGSLNSDESLRYRLISLYRNDEGKKDYNFNEKKIFISPSIQYDINDNNSISLMAEYLDETKHSDFGTFVKNDGTLATPSDFVSSHPDEQFLKEQKVLGFDFSSSYDSWNSLFRYRFVDYDRNHPKTHMPFFYNEANNTITKFFSTQRFQSKEHAFQYTLNKELELFNKKHRFSAGLDYRIFDYEYTGDVDLTSPYVMNLSNRVYESLTNLSDHANAIKYINDEDKVKRYGAFIQDNINLSDNLILSAGLRYDKVNPRKSNSSDSLLPQFGLVYKLTPSTSIYTNYSESFIPQTKVDNKGNLLEPEEGKGYELGLKQKLNEKFNLNIALFKIEKKNVAIQVSPPLLVYTPSGKQESKGLEFDLLGEILPGWSILTSYSYTKTEDKSDNKGKEFAGIPKHSANVFTSFKLDSLGLQNTSLGLGAKYIGSRYANSNNSIKIASNMVYNASLSYKKDALEVNFNVQNLNDEEYVTTATTARATQGAPRTAILSVKYSF